MIGPLEVEEEEEVEVEVVRLKMGTVRLCLIERKTDVWSKCRRTRAL